MKRFIWISILFLFATGCGSRSVQKEKSFQQSKENSKQSEASENLSQSVIDLQIDTEVKKVEISQEKQVKDNSSTQSVESTNQKTKTESNSKTLKKTEYYPNGQKKSEMELSEQYSKVSDERDYYKSRTEQLEKSLNISIKKQDSIYKQNLDFAQKNKSLVKLNKESLLSWEQTDKELKKVSERKGITFGTIVWIVFVSLISGAVIWEIIKKYIPKWSLKIFNLK